MTEPAASTAPYQGELPNRRLGRPAQYAIEFRYIACLLLIALAAFALSLYFFCPRFIMWRGIQFPFAPFSSNPETNRAVDVLRQVRDPLVKIDNPSNVVIQWRLLFPLLVHYLHLPPWVILVLPPVGCLAVLAYAAHLMRRDGAKWRYTFCAAALIATGSWFFVSTGWLTYNDSWYMLGLLVVCFSPGRIGIGVACALEPFIDERFVLTLPLACAIRFIYFCQIGRFSIRAGIRDAVVIFALTLPYVATRLILFRGNADPGTHALLQDLLNDLHQNVPWYRWIQGWWMGLRMAWLYVAAAALILLRQRSLKQAWLFIAIVSVTIAMDMFIAADIGRNASAAWPAAILGLLLLSRSKPAWFTRSIPLLLVANLLLPAQNVVSLFTIPIESARAEIKHYQDPPYYDLPETWVNESDEWRKRGRDEEALRALDIAIGLDDQDSTAYLRRAEIYMQTADLPKAAADADRAMELGDKSADALFVRGTIHTRQDQSPQAAALLEKALSIAPPDWPRREQCRQTLSQIRGGK